MARAVVTGAAGFLGGALAHALRRRGDEVVALDVRRGPGVTSADVSRPGDWEKALDGADLVIHAAAVGTGGVGELTPVRPGRAGAPLPVSDEEIRRVTLGGTAAVLDAAARVGVARFIHLSCVSVLGSDAGSMAAETVPIGLTGDVRADALAAAEQAVGSSAAHGLPATVLRLGDAYGPRAGRWTLWPVLLLRAGRFLLVDGGRGVLSPVHIDDVVAAVMAVAAADRAAVAGEVLHVTGGQAVRAADFFGHYSRMLAGPAPRSLPARVFEAVDAIDRVRSLAAGAAGAGVAGAGVAGAGAAGAGMTGAGVAGGSVPARRRPGIVRGIGARLVSGVDPRTRIDLGPLTVRDLTRDGTVSIEKIHSRVGWSPTVDLAAGMDRTESWLRERGLLGVQEPARRG